MTTPFTPLAAVLPIMETDTMPDAMLAHLQQTIDADGGWIGFDRFMAEALYAPGLGYYSRGSTVFGVMPQGLREAGGEVVGAGSDFVTAPEMTPLFGQALARQIAQALQVTGTDEIWEFGAGTGALALQILDALDALGVPVRRYTIVDLSQPLKARQQAMLHQHLDRVQGAEALPDTMRGGVVVVAPLKEKIAEHLGKPVALSTIYRMLARNGWRKLAPDTAHTKGDTAASEDWKTNSRGGWIKS